MVGAVWCEMVLGWKQFRGCVFCPSLLTLTLSFPVFTSSSSSASSFFFLLSSFFVFLSWV
jgi:hypothetical protein